MPCVNAQGILLLYEHTYKRHSGGLIAPPSVCTKVCHLALKSMPFMSRNYITF